MTSSPEKLLITPKTRVHELLVAYPELEARLIERVPAFAKLRNPVIRQTVARVTTLQQAAAVGGVPLEGLINMLREAVGQDVAHLSESGAYLTEQPPWFSDAKVKAELDLRPMLAQGEHPVHEVMERLRGLSRGEIFSVLAPFLPAPLIDKAKSLGFEAWVKRESAELFKVYFSSKEGQ